MKLALESIVKRYDGKRVLDDISLSLDKPGPIALLGTNGSGKSTLLRIAAGVIEPDSGRVLVDDESITRASSRKKIGYVPESADPLPESTVAELISLCAALKRAPLPDDEAIARIGATEFMGHRIGTLSLGQRRRACLLAALVGAPKLLLLDEPTNGLDTSGVAMLSDLIREHAHNGGISVIATHDLEFADAIAAKRIRIASGQIQT